MSQSDKPGILDRLRGRFPWFDHVMRAWTRYQDANGDFFAAGITYFTVFALFPLVMVGFSVAAFVLKRQQHLLAQMEDHIKHSVSGDLGPQLINLMESAIRQGTSVGIVGLAVAAWAGLGWMANLRQALSAMWEQKPTQRNFVVKKLSDLAALLSAFVAILITVCLTALGSGGLLKRVLSAVGLGDLPGLASVLRLASIVVSLVISWLLFTWIISRLPRHSVSFSSSVRAGLLAAVGFEIFKQVGSIYLQKITHGPAGAVFGSVLGLMVFAYITARLILFATAWAATSVESLAAADVAPPEPAVISTRVRTREGIGMGEAAAAIAVGALAALGISWMGQRR